MEAELQTEIALYVTKHRPQDAYEHDLIRRAALGNLRARRISITLNALTDDRIRNATRLWDETRASEIAKLASNLPYDPEKSLDLLQRTTEGCDYLADAWESLSEILKSQGYWSENETTRAFHLLGHPKPPKLNDPTPLGDLYRLIIALQFKHNKIQTAKTHFLNNPHVISIRDLPPADEALETLLEFTSQRIATLESEAQTLWDTYDLPSRQSAASRAAFDTSPEFTLLNRYLNTAERHRRQALDELARLRRNQPDDQPATPRPQDQSPLAPNQPANPNPNPPPRPYQTNPPPQPPRPKPKPPNPLRPLLTPSSTTSSPLSQPSPPSPSPSADPHSTPWQAGTKPEPRPRTPSQPGAANPVRGDTRPGPLDNLTPTPIPPQQAPRTPETSPSSALEHALRISNTIPPAILSSILLMS